MATINICGFELGSTLEFFELNNTASIQTTTKRTGNYALQVNPVGAGTGWIYLRSLQANGLETTIGSTTVYIRFYFRVGTLPAANSEEFFELRSSNIIMTGRIKSDGKLQLYAANGTTQIGSDSATALSTNKWYRIDVKFISASSCELRIDGVSAITGIPGSDTVSNISLGKLANRNDQTVNFYYDDVAIDTAQYPPDGAIEIMLPSADGNYTTWTIGAGSGDKWQQVDDLPHDSDTSYLVSTLTVDNAYTAAMEAAANAGISGTINTVKSIIISKQDGAGSGTYSRRLRSGSTDSDGSNTNSSASYATASRMFATDPATSAAWTISGLDGVEVGIVEKETVDKTRITAIYLMVDFLASTGGGSGGSKGKKPPIIKPPKGGGGGGGKSNTPNFRHKIWILDE
jgi:hypothetical protein